MIRALLVDDEGPARDRLRALLAEQAGIEIVGEAECGEDALALAAALRPDLVFLDIQMPGLSGLAVAASLPPPRPAIIFCTAYDQYAIEAFEHHAVDYLLKPLNRERLLRAVERVRRAAEEREAARREVADAAETQSRLLPQALPGLATLDYAGACRMARGVGGDYYDFLSLPDGLLALAVGDVSGKGVFAGLLMAAFQARLQSLAPLWGRRLEGLLRELNRALLASTGENRYVTFFYGVYDDASRRLDYINAGHNPPLLFRARADKPQHQSAPLEPPRAPSDIARPPGSSSRGKGGGARAERRAYGSARHEAPGAGESPPNTPVGADETLEFRLAERLDPNGAVLGLMPDARFQSDSIALEAGDILVVFTDGLIDAQNGRGEELGEGRLESFIAERAALDAAALKDSVLGEVERFRGQAPAQDDMTLVVAKGR